MKIKSTFLLILIFMLSLKSFSQTKIETTEPFTIGETISFKSDVLKENRTLNIYLPNGYIKNPEKEYPVIYVLDGSKDEDFIHIAGIVQFGSFSWINMLPESIVVGIANVDRKRDFTYPTTITKDKEDFPTTGKSKNFIQFIEKELQPLIDRNYNTNNVKTIIGQSLGGLLAAEILFKKPHLFTNYIIVSPSIWWDNESLLKLKPEPYNTKKSIYIAVGKEGEIMERTAKNFFNLVDNNNKANSKIYFNYFENQDHGDALHLAVYDAFEKIFKH